jgi:flavorubredoxin
MWDSTRRMAELIAQGIGNADKDVTVKLFNSAKDDKNDIITEVFKSKAILVGSPTINNGYLFSIGGMLEMMKGLKFKGKKAAAFGSYGWSGEAVKQISEHLSASGFELADDGLRLLWAPDENGIRECVNYGEKFADAVK